MSTLDKRLPRLGNGELIAWMGPVKTDPQWHTGEYDHISVLWLHWSAAQRRLWRQGDTRRRMFA